MNPWRCEFRPFEHYIYDDEFSGEHLRAVDAEWPGADWPYWHRYEHGKRASKDPLRFPPATAALMQQLLTLNIRQMTGIGKTFADWTCYAAGMHEIEPGGCLPKHLDSDHHPIFKWRRACNAILCVNSHWENSWGGYFCLCDSDGETIKCRYPPLPGRLFLFPPTNTSFHEVARVVGPVPRRTLLAVYYTKDDSPCLRNRAKFIAKEETCKK